MAPDVTTLLLKSHLRATKRVRYVGDRLAQAKRVRLKPLFVEFVCKHLAFFRETHGYQLRPGCTQPGQKAHIFLLFRDEWLPRALHEMRAEDEGKPVDDVPPTRYLYKRNQNLTTDEPCVRAVHGWQDLHYAPKKEPNTPNTPNTRPKAEEQVDKIDKVDARDTGAPGATTGATTGATGAPDVA